MYPHYPVICISLCWCVGSGLEPSDCPPTYIFNVYTFRLVRSTEPGAMPSCPRSMGDPQTQPKPVRRRCLLVHHWPHRWQCCPLLPPPALSLLASRGHGRCILSPWVRHGRTDGRQMEWPIGLVLVPRLVPRGDGDGAGGHSWQRRCLDDTGVESGGGGGGSSR